MEKETSGFASWWPTSEQLGSPPVSDVKEWSVFMVPIQTNNDVEGWHRRLNGRTHGRPTLYAFIQMLYKESQYVSVQVWLVSDQKLARYMWWKHQNVQGLLFQLWDEYMQKKRTAWSLSKACARVYSPCPWPPPPVPLPPFGTPYPMTRRMYVSLMLELFVSTSTCFCVILPL